jgi:hypothetical protein
VQLEHERTRPSGATGTGSSTIGAGSGIDSSVDEQSDVVASNWRGLGAIVLASPDVECARKRLDLVPATIESAPVLIRWLIPLARRCVARGVPPHPIAVCTEAERTGTTPPIPHHRDALAALVDNAPPAGLLEYLVADVKLATARDALRHTGRRLMDCAQLGDASDLARLVEWATTELATVAAEASRHA